MNDPFYKEFDDGSEFDYKMMLSACAAGAVMAAVVVPATIAWQNSWYKRQELKKKIKNKVKHPLERTWL